jgi:hypothetical protein
MSMAYLKAAGDININPECIPNNEKRMQEVLCAVFKDDKILLKFNMHGRSKDEITLLGGKTLNNETPFECAKREIAEHTEMNLNENNLYYNGKFFNILHGRVDSAKITNLFSLKNFQGNVINDGIDKLQWCRIAKIPYEKMHKDICMWMPLLVKMLHFNVYEEYINTPNGRSKEIEIVFKD